MVTLVVSRWLLGFCFSKHDLDLLDNPIPDSLYCRPCKPHPTSDPTHSSPRTLDLEGGSGSVDTFGNNSSTHCSTSDMPVTSEPIPAALAATNPHMHRKQRVDSFNITHEVDSCDLWKNLVKLDAPLPSPRETPKFHIGSPATTTDTSSDFTDGGRGAWHRPSAECNLTLGTLEECDTDLESQSQLPDYESITSPRYVSLPSPQDSNMDHKRGFSLSHQTTPTSAKSEHAQWNGGGHYNGSSTRNEPVLLAYQSTSV